MRDCNDCLEQQIVGIKRNRIKSKCEESKMWYLTVGNKLEYLEKRRNIWFYSRKDVTPKKNHLAIKTIKQPSNISLKLHNTKH